MEHGVADRLGAATGNEAVDEARSRGRHAVVDGGRRRVLQGLLLPCEVKDCGTKAGLSTSNGGKGKDGVLGFGCSPRSRRTVAMPAQRWSGDTVHGEVTAVDMVARRWLDSGVVTAQARCSEARRSRAWA